MRRVALLLILGPAIAACAPAAIEPAGAPVPARPAQAAAAMPSIGHVFIITLENENGSTTFGPNPPSPYLAKTLTGEGAYLPNYYGIGHESNDNYVAMISGQAPNPENQADCQDFDTLEPGTIGSYGQAVGQGCVFPSDVPTIGNQLDAAGLTWRDYDQSMGADPTRESAVCAHPGIGQQDNTQTETATDAYATRHNPFVYFHSIIDDTTLCDTHVVNLNLLPADLKSAATTPNYLYIVPDLCGDGHDLKCSNPSRPGGFAGIQQFLEQWVPEITNSPAFKTQNGLLIITFDESDSYDDGEAVATDSSSCCGEIAGPNSPEPGIHGPGGGVVGAVLLSPCIAPGTVSKVPYNHYSMLRSVEDIFGLAHLGYAQLPGEQSFGPDVFTRKCTGTRSVAIRVDLRAPPLASSVATSPRVTLRWSSTGPARSYTVQVDQTSAGGHGYRTLLRATTRHSLRFAGTSGATYEFRVSATSDEGVTTAPVTTTVVIPTRARVTGGRYRGPWRLAPVRDGWFGQALIGSPGASFSLSYVGATLRIIGSVWPQGGLARVTIDGKARTIDLHSDRAHARRVLYRAVLAPGHHRLEVRVLRGVVPVEGVAITDRQR